MAFSGGGIRSAAFCSGVLSRLLEKEVEVDYLSCVSGGGYTGTAYLDWKYHEENKDESERRQGKGEGGWHKEFYTHMRQRSGYICDWTGIICGCWDTVILVVFCIVTFILPAISWGFYAFPVAVIIDLIFGKLMRHSEDCDAALTREREVDGTVATEEPLTTRCESESSKRGITWLFLGLFLAFIVLYFITSKLLKRCPCLKSFMLLIEYAIACMLIFTFIPYTIYDFFVKIDLVPKILVGFAAFGLWLFFPFLRKKISYAFIVFVYSFVIYWKVFRIDLPGLFLKHEDHVSHWMLLSCGIFFFISSFMTNWNEKLVHCYLR